MLSNLPWQLPGPHGPMIFNGTASGASGGVILYSEQDPTTSLFNTFAQLTDPSGNLVGSPIEVNTPSGGDAIAADVAEAPDGNIVAVYVGQGPQGAGIYFRQINADGTLPQSSETGVGFTNYQGGSPYLQLPSVAIDPDDNFAIASSENGLQLFSWDLSSVSQPAQFDPNQPGNFEPAISIATDGTLVETYAGGDPSTGSMPQFAQQFSYATDGNGGFTITPLGDAVSLGTALTSVPVAEPDGSFAAIIGGPDFEWNAGETGTIFEQHFAADGTPIDASPVQVSPNISTAAWVAGAGLDESGNLYVGWYTGDIWYSDFGDGRAPTLFAQEIRPDNTMWSRPLQITPTTAMVGAASWAAASISVGQDGSLLAGWTSVDTTTGNVAVQARHYDPITDVKTETDTLPVPGSLATVQVTSSATTMGDSVLWEYWVTGHGGQNIGQFAIAGAPQGVTDVSSSPGWTANSTGTGWTANSSQYDLAPWATGYFTFTAPAEYALQPTAATVGGSAFTTPATGNVLGPGLTAPETDTLLAGSLGGQISVASSVTPDGVGDLIWDYQVTNNSSSSIGEFAFLDAPIASIPSFTGSLGWAVNEDDTGWQAGPTDTLLAPNQTADFNFMTTSVAADHIAVRATSSDGTDTAEGTVLGPSDPSTDTTTNTANLTDGYNNAIAVTSTATTFSTYVLWQYTVTNNSQEALGQFSIAGQPTSVQDEYSSLGWTPDSTGSGWTAGPQPLINPGQAATFSFTTSWAYSAQPTPAQAGGESWSNPATGTVNGPQPRIIDQETYTSYATDYNPDGNQEVEIVSTATEFTDHILWQYQVNNINYTDGSYVGVNGFWLFSVEHPGTPLANNITNDQGWLGGDTGDQTGTSNPAGAVWGANNIAPDTPNAITPGQTAFFSYTTPVVPIGLVKALVGTGDLVALFGAMVLGSPTPAYSVHGPGAVPGNSTYTYVVDLGRTVGKGDVKFDENDWKILRRDAFGNYTIPANPTNATITNIGWIHPSQNDPGVIAIWAEVTFVNQPADLQVGLVGAQITDANGNFQPMDVAPLQAVYDVQVTVRMPDPPAKAFVPATSFTALPSAKIQTTVNGQSFGNSGLVPNNTGYIPVKTISSSDIFLQPPPQNPTYGLKWQAKVILTGPGAGNLGVNQITAGFFQHASLEQASVHFSSARTTIVSSLVGNKPAEDVAAGQPGPWYSSNPDALLNGSSGAGGTYGTIKANDNPTASFPVWYISANGNLALDPDIVHWKDVFALDVAATTSAAVAVQADANSFWTESTATGGWAFNASGFLGPIASDYNPFISTAQIVTPPTGWSASNGPKKEDYSGPTFNTLLGNMTWSDRK